VKSLLLFVAHKSKLGKLKASQYVLVASLCTLLACARPHVPPAERLTPSPETALTFERFEQAERLVQNRAYTEALAIYQDYLKRFPRGPLADTALMKTGTSYMAVKAYPQARKAFERLLSDYSTSLFVEDARFNVMLTYYEEGNYNAAIEYAQSAMGLAKTPYQEFRIHQLIGYTYSASKQFKDAITSYMTAYKLTSQPGRTEIVSIVKELIGNLKEPDLNLLIDLYGNAVPGGYLRLQLAKEYASEDRLELAIKALSDFIGLFPDHDEIGTAVALIEEFEARRLFNRFSVGCILPLSGPYRTFGQRALTGIEFALDRFNAQPFVNQIQLVIKDSRGDPAEAANAVDTLVLAHGVAAIIGPMITSESAALRAQALKVPILTLTQKSGVTELGDYVFRNFLTLSCQVEAVVDYAVGDLGLQRFAIMYPDEGYGISFMNRFWDELMRRGAEVVAIESYAPEQTDFSDAIKKLVGLYYPRPEEPIEEEMEAIELPFGPTEATASDQDPLLEEEQEPEPIVDFEAIFIPDSFEKAGLIAPQLLYHDVSNVLLIGTNLWHSKKLIDMAGRYAQGAVVPDGFFINSPSLKVQAFAKGYEDIFGRPPAFLQTQAYDAAWILFEAVNEFQVESRRTLKTALLEVKDFSGITGLTSFDETGDAKKRIYLLKVKGRRFVQIRP
jgi:ABC-type branched-subunit amino acid transport system substrate-binding protein